MKTDEILPLKKLLDQFEKYAVKEFEKNGEVIPTCMAMTPDNKLTIISVPDIGDRNKNGRSMSPRSVTLNYLRLKAIEMNFNRVVIFHEAWLLSTPSQDEGREWAGKIHEHPDKIEALVVCASSRRDKMLSTYFIEREGSNVKLKKNIGQFENISGDFFNIVPPRQPDTDMRKQADLGLLMLKEISNIGSIEIKIGDSDD